jgi:hypothetical protein
MTVVMADGSKVPRNSPPTSFTMRVACNAVQSPVLHAAFSPGPDVALAARILALAALSAAIAPASVTPSTGS